MCQIKITFVHHTLKNHELITISIIDTSSPVYVITEVEYSEVFGDN